jgi:hypothetical protein
MLAHAVYHTALHSFGRTTPAPIGTVFAKALSGHAATGRPTAQNIGER